MDTLVMAVRCALLIIVTVAFAVLWSGDKPDQVAVVDRPANIRFDQRDTDRENQNKTRKSSEGEVDVETPSASAPTPKDITPGTYVVVDHLGRSEVRVISGLEHESNLPSRNHYSIEVGKARWHFIRLNIAEIDRTAKALQTDSVLK